MTIDEIIDEIIRREGGDIYTNRSADRGGPTKFGVTQATLSRWRGRPCSPDDVKALGRQEAEDIYRHEYVNKFDAIPYEATKVMLVDWGVTSGPDDPTRALQQVFRALNFYNGAIDGIMGPKSLEACRRADVPWPSVHAEILRLRVRFYFALAFNDERLKALMKANPRMQIHNLRGWVYRALEFIDS